MSACQRDLSDPFIPKDKKFKTQFKYSKSQNRTVENHSGFARRKGKFSDTFAAGKNGGVKSHRQGTDSYSSKPARSRYTHSASHDSYSSRKVINNRQGNNRNHDSFSSRKKRSGTNSFGSDSYSRRANKTRKQNQFSNSKNRVVNKGTFGKQKNQSNDNFSFKRSKSSGMFRFDKKNNRIVTSKKLRHFDTKKRERESGSFNVKRHSASRQFSFNNKKKLVTRNRFVLGGLKRFRKGSDSFSGGQHHKSGEFGFNHKKKRVSKKFVLFKPRDTDAGTFGGKTRTKNSMNQNSFNDKTKRTNHSRGTKHNLFSGTKRKNHKKKEREMDLFDPQMKRRLNFGP